MLQSLSVNHQDFYTRSGFFVCFFVVYNTFAQVFAPHLEILGNLDTNYYAQDGSFYEVASSQCCIC